METRRRSGRGSTRGTPWSLRLPGLALAAAGLLLGTLAAAPLTAAAANAPGTAANAPTTDEAAAPGSVPAPGVVPGLALPSLPADLLLPARPPAPTPGPEDGVLTVEQIRTDQYPKVTMRFSIRPIGGPPPTYLEIGDVGVVVEGRGEPPMLVQTVGRVPTSGAGTYEVVWQTGSQAAAGQTIVGRLGISINSRPEVDTTFSFTRPYPAQAAAPPYDTVASALAPVPLPEPGTVDMDFTGAVAGILGGCALLAGVAGIAAYGIYRRKQERMAIWVGRSTAHRAQQISREEKGRKPVTISPMTQMMARLGARLVPSGQGDKLRRSLLLAGRPTNQHYIKFVASKASLSIGLFMGGFWLMVSVAPLISTLAVALCMGTVGFILPNLWLGRWIKTRRFEMRKALPDALDLMTIGVSAGLAFDGALGEIIEKWDNEISREFAIMLGELRMGIGRRQALLNLADRTGFEEMQIMVSQLIQAEELGMSLTETLLTLSGQMRLRRRQRAEELAQKAAVKMLIPLVFLIFPALFVVILGPAAQDLMHFFSDGPR